MSARAGFTLVELIVVIALLGIMAAVIGLAIPGQAPRSADDVAAKVFNGRGEALRTGNPVVVWLGGDSAVSAVAFPDGSVVADSSIHVDRFTGQMRPDPEAAR